MNDTQAKTLRAALAALSQASDLSRETKDKLKKIAADLENTISDLGTLMEAEPKLCDYYQEARRWLTQTDAERKAGLSVLANTEPEPKNAEIGNTLRVRPSLEDAIAQVEPLDKDTLERESSGILASDNPSATFCDAFAFAR